MAKLGLNFDNPVLLEQAFTHRSDRSNARSGGFINYERLEFLGDSILGFIVAEYLVNHYPNKEGELTAWLQELVSNKMLIQIAEDIGLPEFLAAGEVREWETEEKITKRKADVVEALIGAIYMDKGYAEAQLFVETHILSHLPEVLARDAQFQLHRLCREELGNAPRHIVSDSEDEEGNHLYHVDIELQDEVIGEGEGTLLRYAHENASRVALATRFPDFVLPEGGRVRKTESVPAPPGAVRFLASLPAGEELDDRIEVEVPEGTAKIVKTTLFLARASTFCSLDPTVQEAIVNDLSNIEPPLQPAVTTRRIRH
jgi:ribonuclease-3